MIGQVYTWNLLGYGFVLVGKKEIYFLHLDNVVQGADEVKVGATVEFDAAPARAGKKYPQAVNAVVGGA